MTQTALVIGGSGFIGAATCRALERRGVRPIVADVTAGAGSWEQHVIDTAQADEVHNLVATLHPDAVVNLAFRLADACENNLDGAFRVNVLGSQNVIEACRRAGIARYVYASSIAVYGDQSSWGDHALKEGDFGHPVRLYGWHKLLVEEIAARYSEQGLSCAGLRISTVYGSGRRAGLSSAINALIDPPAEASVIRCPWSMDEAFDLIHVDDVAESLCALALTPMLDYAIYNSGGEYATVSSISATLHELRPDVSVKCDEPPGTLAHCSRINWERLRALTKYERPSLEKRMSEAVTSG
ncbi:MAG TPA: NAD(P)-dependent oxidoreductase [Acidimicrobiales bacterium]|jgi:nucleoside-diphosphate-sugar epimerase|nr:NAD(P)-dependent oxidoreductase [Acidimicrobiales bacterium]